MKRILKGIITAALPFSLLLTGVMNANAFELSIERAQQGEVITQYMKVEGEASRELRYKPVSLVILRPGMEVDSAADFNEKYAAMYQTYVRADNKYVFNFPFNEEEGEYTVLIRVINSEVEKKTISCYSIDDLVFLLNGLKNESLTEEEVCELLTLSYENLGVDGSLFSQLGDESRLAISGGIMASMEEYTVDELSSYLYEKTFVKVFSSDDTTELREKVISAYMESFGDEIRELCEKYFALPEEIREGVLKEIKKGKPGSLEEIAEMLPDACFVCEFGEIDNFSEIIALLSAYSSDERISAVKASLESFSASRQNIILRNVLKKRADIEGIESFAGIFRTVTNNIEILEQENNKPSGGGGGGGGGGGSVKKNESTVTVTPSEKEEKEEYSEVIERIYFDDIAEVSWASGAINALTSAGIINGREKGKFAPYGNITRAEFSKICALALNITAKNNDGIPFKDVASEHWSYEYIRALYQNGFIQGVSPDSFNPEAEITRQDIAVILFRIATMRGYEFNMESFGSDFSDNDKIASYALSAVGMLSRKGVILGFEGNEFKPHNKATRAETAVIVQRIMQMLEEEIK